MKAAIKQQVKNLPGKPGVYRYYSDNGDLLYVGKARNLKKRVASYFTKSDASFRIRHMVRKIDKVEYTVVANEYDALLLENSLIKQYQPRFNINLKDDKSYPYIVVRNERFPRVHPTRQRFDDGSQYYGPYASVSTMKGMLEIIRRIFPTRSCSYNLSPENIEAHKFRVCLDYHIKLCKGPCEAKTSETAYQENIEGIRLILKGQTAEVQKYLEGKMQECALEMNFEGAQEYKERVDVLKRFQAKSTIVSPSMGDVDVFNIYSNEHYSFINYLKVIQGAIV